MADCNKCKRTDIKCCPTCARNPYTCNVWHRCEKDCEGYEPRIKSQADRIRAMSDEELARAIALQFLHGVGTEWILQWLKSEAKE